ncbi:4'-phosphopantetheinyl transferase superfamily protein [Pontibacter qinzhouensis]|uniref:4'-phosphopantetheinyl transferase superfamily protein n=1 Tax=Pontibacter qinzhouensis TaxID=2603253 RepID=A0A5C8KA55_9BACT|nr:4'-phosphopantetheinyl transferase superfamily protein [Pontibacter qinzhouensis]TXK48998.1 4'-phosphopantetheinyl transferase superfamily protein [Pontibacter qinzhouensis]
MPLIQTMQPAPRTLIGIWQIEEPAAELYAALPPQADLSALQGKVHPKREQEWLASRMLAYTLLQQFTEVPLVLCRNEHGKPYFEQSDIQLSITHSPQLAAVIVSADHQVGIDIELVSQKALRVADRFLAESEKTCTAGDDIKTCLYWSAKETLYKMYSKRNLIFKENILLAPSETENTLRGLVQTANFSRSYEVCFENVDNHILTYCIDNAIV